MASVVIVEVQEVYEGLDAFGLGSVGTDVGPFFELGAVESLDAPMFVKPLFRKLLRCQLWAMRRRFLERCSASDTG